MKIYKIKMTGPCGVHYVTDGRDEGGHWFTYSRDVAERMRDETDAYTVDTVECVVVSS